MRYRLSLRDGVWAYRAAPVEEPVFDCLSPTPSSTSQNGDHGNDDFMGQMSALLDERFRQSRCKLSNR